MAIDAFRDLWKPDNFLMNPKTLSAKGKEDALDELQRILENKKNAFQEKSSLRSHLLKQLHDMKIGLAEKEASLSTLTGEALAQARRAWKLAYKEVDVNEQALAELEVEVEDLPNSIKMSAANYYLFGFEEKADEAAALVWKFLDNCLKLVDEFGAIENKYRELQQCVRNAGLDTPPSVKSFFLVETAFSHFHAANGLKVLVDKLQKRLSEIKHGGRAVQSDKNFLHRGQK